MKILMPVAVMALIGCSHSSEKALPFNSSEQSTATDDGPKVGEDRAAAPPKELDRGGKGAPGPAPAKPVLWLEPHDLASDTRLTPIRAVVQVYGVPLADGILEDIAKSLELHTADGEFVSVEKRLHNPPSATPDGGDTNAPAYVELVPKAPVPPGWTVLSLSQAVDGIDLAPWSAPKPSHGVYAARFNTASAPSLARIMFCMKGRVVIEFSENVLSSESASAFSVVRTSNEAACALASSTVENAHSSPWMDFDCDVAFDDSYRLEWKGTVHAPSGAVFLGPSGSGSGVLELALADLPWSQDEATCREWRP